jgi:PAS domain S-box-containing protein
MATATTTRSVRVLHVDDDPSYRDVTSTFLEKELPSADVVTAGGADAGLERLDDGGVDCVVSDYDMPRTDGLEFLEQVREDHPDLPFVLYTGKGSEEIAGRAINAGVTGYLQKGGPDQHRRLANRVDHAVAEYQAKVESERYSSVLRALGYPIYVVDADGTFDWVNDAFVDLVGYDRERLVDAEPDLFKTDDSVERANDALRTIVSSEGPDTRQFEIEIEPREGEAVPCRDHMAALPFDDEFRGSVGILRDVSEERRRERALDRQDDLLADLLAALTGDLRAPLADARAAADRAADGDAAAFDDVAAAHDDLAAALDDLAARVEDRT